MLQRVRTVVGGFLVLLAVYQGVWCVLFIATHLWSGDWFIRVNVVGNGIAAVCCGVVGWSLVRPTSRRGAPRGPGDAEGDTAVTAA